MFIKSCILCSLITICAARAVSPTYLSTLKNLTSTQCPLYENFLLKLPSLDQCTEKRPLLDWKYRNDILCWMYSTVFKHFCISTNSSSVYESEDPNLMKASQEETQKPSQLRYVCNSLQRISPSVLTADVVEMFNSSTKCAWLCGDFKDGLVVEVCSLTSFMWELSEKYAVKVTTVGKVSQETTNSSETMSSPAVKSKLGIDTELKHTSTTEAVNKNKGNAGTNVNESKVIINGDVNQHSPKESAVDTKTDDAHQTNSDKPTDVGQGDGNSKGSIQVSQASDNSTLSKDVVTSKDKKNSQKVTAHENSGPALTPEDIKSIPSRLLDKPTSSDTNNVKVPNDPVITGEVSNHSEDFKENTKPKSKSEVQKIPKNQEEDNLGILNGDGKIIPNASPNDTPVEPRKKVIPSVKDQSTTSQVVPQVVPHDEEKKIEDIPDTKDDIILGGDLDDDDPKYDVDNDEPPLLQKTTKGKSDNAEEEGYEPQLPKYSEVKNKVDVIKPKEIDEDNLNIAANYQNQNIDDSNSYFFSYFMMVCVVFIFGYVAYHNKQKILALVLEGRRGRRPSRSRRPNSSNYRKLDSTLEEAVTSSCNKNSTQVIY